MYHLQSISQMMNTPNNKKAKATTTTISTTTTPTSVITKIVTTKTTVQPQHNNKTNLFIRIRHNKRYSLARLKLHYHLYTETRYNENSPEFQT